MDNGHDLTMQAPHATTRPATVDCRTQRLWALMACAGHGARAQRDAQAPVSKQYQMLAGKTLLAHTLQAFAAVGYLQGILLAIAPGDAHGPAYAQGRVFTAPCGGATRAATVLAGLRVLAQRGANPEDWVLVHDAARCLVTPCEIQRLIDACANDAVGGLLATPLADTLKTAIHDAPHQRAASTLPRSDKWLAQTPQMFRLGALTRALEQAGGQVTDEASAMELAGLHPLLVQASAQNFKITHAQDFALAEAILALRNNAGHSP